MASKMTKALVRNLTIAQALEKLQALDSAESDADAMSDTNSDQPCFDENKSSSSSESEAEPEFGIRFWLAVDVQSKHMPNGVPYIGKDETRSGGELV